MKFFTIAGPVKPAKNYCVPLAMRLNEHELHQFIEQEKYFVLHAPRQTGKTSTILNFAKQLNKEGKYTALYINIEGAQSARDDYVKGLYTVLEEFLSCIQEQLPEEIYIITYLQDVLDAKNITGASLTRMLGKWASH